MVKNQYYQHSAQQAGKFKRSKSFDALAKQRESNPFATLKLDIKITYFYYYDRL